MHFKMQKCLFGLILLMNNPHQMASHQSSLLSCRFALELVLLGLCNEERPVTSESVFVLLIKLCVVGHVS